MRTGLGEEGTRVRLVGTLSFLLALQLAAPLVAQDRGPRHRPGARGGEDVQETIQVLMIVSMKRALELTPEQEMKVVPRVREMLGERERFAQGRRDALRRLQIKVLEESAADGEFREAVGHLEQIEEAHHALEGRLREEIDRSLSPRQQAQLRLFVPRFRRQMQLRIEQARRLQERSTPMPPVPVTPGSDFDDDEF